MKMIFKYSCIPVSNLQVEGITLTAEVIRVLPHKKKRHAFHFDNYGGLHQPYATTQLLYLVQNKIHVSFVYYNEPSPGVAPGEIVNLQGRGRFRKIAIQGSIDRPGQPEISLLFVTDKAKKSRG